MLTNDERHVLEIMGYDTNYAFNFAAFDLPRERAREACRSLREKGYAVFMRGLWSEDGMPAGSGYGPTKAGVYLRKAIEAFAWWPFCECCHQSGPLWDDPRAILDGKKP